MVHIYGKNHNGVYGSGHISNKVADLQRDYASTTPSGEGGTNFFNKIGAKAGEIGAAHPIGSALGSFTVGAGAALGIAALINKWRKKRHGYFTEGVLFPVIFSDKTLTETRDVLSELSDEFISYLCETSNEVVYGLITEAINTEIINENSALTESVTFINNNGRLKTTSTKEYISEMHEYEKPFNFKSLKRKSLKEDLENMTLEEIFSEID